MRSKKFLLISFFILLHLKGFSAVFVVTSNADSGPGTLRDALTQAAANGSATTDYVNFNIADQSEAGRTINISSTLPILTSNLILDATTQPGAKFGISDAKIKIVAQVISNNNNNSTLLYCLLINSGQNIEIYGFSIEAAYLNDNSYGVIGIESDHANNLTIGGSGKGNLINTAAGIKMNYDGPNNTYNRNIKISSNIFGISENNVSLALIGENIDAERVVNLTIGGTTPAEGNKFSTQVVVSENNNSEYDIHTGNLFIANNNFGTDFTGTKDFTNPNLGCVLLINCYYLSGAQLRNNLFVGLTDIGLDVNCFFYFTGNKFGTDITGTQLLGTTGFQLVLGYCNGGGIIGGTNPGDGNFFEGAYRQTSLGNGGAVVSNIGSPGVEVVGNTFKCNNTNEPYQLSIDEGQINYFAKIANRTTNTIVGTATPNSRVDLYYSLTCDHCEPEQQFQSVSADANGNWVYSGALLNNNIIASSTFQGTTSEFTTLQFTNQPTDVIIKMACGAKGGSISGITLNSTATYAWYNSLGKLVATTQNLTNAVPGSYYLIVNDGYCSITSPLYVINDASQQIDITHEQVLPASCNQPNGSISGIQADPSLLFLWTDQTGQTVGTYLDLSSVMPGNYTLTARTADGSCSETIGPITIKNLTGPNIDQSNLHIQSTNCGQSTGAIINLAVTGSGTLMYTWLNSQQQTVGTNKDLTGVPAGVYKLQVTDDSQCGPVYSTDFTVPETNSITMDESAEVTANAACGNPTGSITGIVIAGATAYLWTDANNNTYIGSTADLNNIPPGSYTLTASNIYGCNKTSKTYTVKQPAPTQYPAYTATQVPPCFGQSDGSITVSTDSLVKSERWVNSQNQNVGNTSTAVNLPEGVYQLFLTDDNGCESPYGFYDLTDIPPLTLTAQAVANASTCGLNNGSITGLDITGGAMPYTFSWTDASGKAVGTNSNEIANLLSGDYSLTVTDSRCGIFKTNYTIVDNPVNIPAPSVSNIQLCSSGSALIKVNNPVLTAIYNLYSSPTSRSPIDQQTGGVFKITATNNTSFYMTQINGTCESNRAEVDVTVGISAINIANTFTPNGDNFNDYWEIKNIENYPKALVQVFNRYGQKIFESKGYAKPFDGTYNGQKLPSGVYYYIINLSTNCNLLSGSLTIVR